jgi:hypothetical protein
MTSPIKKNKKKKVGRKGEPTFAGYLQREDVIPSFVDPEFDDLDGAEEELREQYGKTSSQD